MEDNSDVDSDGSDIDIGNFDENDDFELREVNRNAEEWLEAMFDSDSDNDMEFEGFQEDWTQNNFTSRLPSRFKLIGGAKVQHPEEAEAHHYYTPRNEVVGGYTGFTMSVCRQILCRTIT